MIASVLPAITEIARPAAGDLDHLADAGEPLVIRGLITDWLAVEAARRSPAALNSYLKAMGPTAQTPVMEAPAATGGRFGYAPGLRDFTFTKRQRSLSETLDRIERSLTQEQPSVIAIQMLPLNSTLPAFERENPMPLLPGIGPLLWLGGPVLTQTHNDRDHNLACVVAGRRRFLLFPPDQVANLYIGPVDNPPPLSLVDPDTPDFVRFPRFAEALAVAQVAELGPGDALLMPRHWWHHVTSFGPYNAMVNYWWGRQPDGLESPQDAFLTARLAIGDLPAAERSYWRAMFAAYVFADDDAAMTHLPPRLRGHLGPMDAGARAALKRRLRSAFGSGR